MTTKPLAMSTRRAAVWGSLTWRIIHVRRTLLGLYIRPMKWIIITTTSLIGLTGCISIDKERAAQQRKAELCAEIDTKDQPHCAGSYEAPPPSY